MSRAQGWEAGNGQLGKVMWEIRRTMSLTIIRANAFCLLGRLSQLGPGASNADTAGIVIKSRAISDSIWRQPGATVWTKLIPAGNLVSSHQ